MLRIYKKFKITTQNINQLIIGLEKEDILKFIKKHLIF